MGGRGVRAGEHEALSAERARRYFREQMGAEAEARRAAEIAALPTRDYPRGTLYSLTCAGGHGWGVPLAVLWHLISLDHFECARHPGALLKAADAR